MSDMDMFSLAQCAMCHGIIKSTADQLDALKVKFKQSGRAPDTDFCRQYTQITCTMVRAIASAVADKIEDN